nr:MAG TPA: Phytotoxin PcF protein [Caudoviricetes sp.]
MSYSPLSNLEVSNCCRPSSNASDVAYGTSLFILFERYFDP